MEFNYNTILLNKLVALQKQLGLSNFNIEVDDEQAFLKYKDLDPNTIYVLTKKLQNDNSIGIDTQPIQIFILSEQNSLDVVKVLFSTFAKKYNFEPVTETYVKNGETHNIWVKQQYSDPVVLSNFNTVDFGYRSTLYMAVTLFIMYDVVDVKNVTVDSSPVKPLAFNISYSMSTNTQQLPDKYISTSRKTVSTFAITMTVPLVKSDFITKVTKIMDGTFVSYDGDNEFTITFDCGLTQVVDGQTVVKPISKTMRLISAQLVTAQDAAPGLQLGFLE